MGRQEGPLVGDNQASRLADFRSQPIYILAPSEVLSGAACTVDDACLPLTTAIPLSGVICGGDGV
jgi:hypothetical protein